MKILKLRLENFKRISTAMKCKSIDIDFTSAKERIILIDGPNGSGKTSILENLHPFSGTGNLDKRDGSPIIEGKNGYKMIEIEDGCDLYRVTHFYTASKNTHTVKSYITLNGEELNPNGNVRSFKDILKEYMEIEEDYLKLLRLGNNVVNFIDLSPTDRKSFMGKLMSAIDMYMVYFKKVTDKLRYYSVQMKSATAKLGRLNISDPKLIKEESKLLEDTMSNLDYRRTKATEQKAIIQDKINSIGNVSELSSSLSDYKSEFEKLSKKIDSFGSDVEEITPDKIQDIELSLNTITGKLNEYSSKRGYVIDKMDSALSEKRTVEIELEKINNDEKLISLRNMVDRLTVDVSVDKERFKNYEPDYTSDIVKDIISSLMEAQNILTATYEFGDAVLSRVVNHMGKNDVQSFIDSKIQSIHSNKLANASNAILEELYKKFPIVYPKCDDKSCPILKFWNEFHDIASKKPDDIRYDEEFYNLMRIAHGGVVKALSILNKKKELFIKMPTEFQQEFILSKVYDHIANTQYIYNREFVNNYLTKITEYEIYLENKDKLDEYKIELSSLDGSSSTKSYLEERLYSIQETIITSRDELSNIDSTILELKDKQSSYEEQLEMYKNVHSYMSRYSELKGMIIEIDSSLKDYFRLSHELNDITNELNQINHELNNQRTTYNDIMYRLKEYKSLHSELEEISKNYDECTYIRKSLSSKEGMPLYLIKLYLDESLEMTNDLLDIAYDGDLYISKFDISASEFNIPYVKNGTEICDVTCASQGEVELITVALSFALSTKNLTKYNIPEFDEVDGPLDKVFSSKFISIVDHQLDAVGAEQSFMISHKDMFDVYPVEVISTIGDKNGTIFIEKNRPRE